MKDWLWPLHFKGSFQRMCLTSHAAVRYRLVLFPNYYNYAWIKFILAIADKRVKNCYNQDRLIIIIIRKELNSENKLERF